MDASAIVVAVEEPARALRLVSVERNPAAVYLASLSESGRRTMGQALRLVVELLARGTDPALFAWESLRAEHVQAVRAALVEREYAPATCNKVLSALRATVREAWRLGLVEAEAFTRIRDVAGVRGSRLLRGREVRQAEQLALFGACARAGASGVRDAAALALLLGCGLRRSEAVGLDAADLRLEPRAATVRVVGKGNKERSVPVPATALPALRAWLALRGGGPGPLLCPVKLGKRRAGHVEPRRMSAQGLMLALRRRAAEAGVERFSPHDLRRSYITGRLRAGKDALVVQRLAGHANVATTVRYDLRGEDEKAAAVADLVVPWVASEVQP